MSSERSRSGGTRISMVLQPVKEIAPKPFIPHLLQKILVGRGDDLNIDLSRHGFTQSTHLPLLENPQKLGLCVEREIGQFVQEQDSSMGSLQQSLAGFPRRP